MNTSKIPPVGSAQTSYAGSGAHAQQQAAGGAPNSGNAAGGGVFSPAAAQPLVFNPEERAKKEMQSFWRMLNGSNEDIKGLAEQMKPKEQPKPQTVPSALGLNLRAALGKMKHAGVTVKGVAQQYSENVPEGYVISQMPGPGTVINGMGMRMVISKGKPPEKERYNQVRRRENVPLLPKDRYNPAEDESKNVVGSAGAAPVLADASAPQEQGIPVKE